MEPSTTSKSALPIPLSIYRLRVSLLKVEIYKLSTIQAQILRGSNNGRRPAEANCSSTDLHLFAQDSNFELDNKTANSKIEAQNFFKEYDRGDNYMAKNNKCLKILPTFFVYNIDGYGLSYLLLELNRSSVFRAMLLRTYVPTFRDGVKASTLSLIVVLKPAQKGVFDPIGNQLSMSFIVKKCELDVALCWLSTLGGAFSALGDNSTSHAAEAGRVSMAQLKIAMKLKDPLIVSRCRLYAAISLLQRGYLKSARDTVKREYRYAKSLPEGRDPRLERMCLGVWAKLQYYWALSLMSKRGFNSFE